jgi:hypothetical protein
LEFVGNFTTVRLTNTQYEGVREYEGEAVIAKWSGYPPDIGRLHVKKTHALNPAFRQYAQSLDDTINGHITTSGMLGLMMLLHHCKEVTAYGGAVFKLPCISRRSHALLHPIHTVQVEFRLSIA